VNELLLHGSILLVLVWLIIGGMGVPLPEDIALLTAGVLAHRGAVPPVLALVLPYAGVIGGDAILFFAARRLGPAAYERRIFRRLLPPARRASIESAYDRYGGRLVFLARHLAGLRAAVFALAGIHGMSPRRFFMWDGLAALVSVPLVVGLGYFGSEHVDEVRAGIATVQHYALLGLGIAIVAGLTWMGARRLRPRRRVETRALGDDRRHGDERPE